MASPTLITVAPTPNRCPTRASNSSRRLATSRRSSSPSACSHSCGSLRTASQRCPRSKERKRVNNNGKDTTMTIDPQHVEALRTRLQGSLLLPGDEGYDKARQTWDAKTFDQHPAVIVLPARASDVQAAVTF